MNPSTALATVLVDELIRQGVRDFVVCPGSRSAPLAYAALAAEQAGRARLHVRVDERSAAFLALGLAKVSRQPAAVITTSGTAVANLHPAVLEASHGNVPLLLLTADRPAEQRGSGANQTTDQVKIFGGMTRWFHEFSAVGRRPGQQGQWRSVIGRAVAESCGHPSGDPGPVHLNVSFREPLTPDTDPAGWSEPLDGRPHGEAWLSLRSPVRHEAAGAGPGIAPVPRTLLILGSLADPARAGEITELADVAGWPIIAEPAGLFRRARVTPHGPLLLSATDWLEENLPERVLVAGSVTLDRRVLALLNRPEVTVEVVTALTSWADPVHAVHRVHDWADIQRSHRVVAGCVDRAWASRWRAAGAVVAATAGPIVEASWPSGPAVARTVANNLPEQALLFVGASSAVRDLDISREPARIAKGVVTVGNRGLAGIDGSVSTAIGAALSQPDRPAYALVGDLTFLHDTNGFLIGPNEPRPDLTIVVVNDDGGAIFSTLEVGAPEYAGSFERIFGTATGADIAGVCAAHHVTHRIVDTAVDLAAAIKAAPQGLTVLEVRVPRTDARRLRRDLAAAVETALTTDSAGE